MTMRTHRYPAAGKPKNQLQDQYTLMALAGVSLGSVHWDIDDIYNDLCISDRNEEEGYELASFRDNAPYGGCVILWDFRAGSITKKFNFPTATVDDLKGITEQLLAMDMYDWGEAMPAEDP